MTDANQLSKRETEVAGLLLRGKSNKQIALVLGISERTVEFHLKNIYQKMGVASRTEAIIKLSEVLHPKLGESTGDNIVKEGETTVVVAGENTDNGRRLILYRSKTSLVRLKISLQEIGGFLVTYKVSIFIWILILILAVVMLIPRPAWKQEREGEYPDEFTVGQVIQRLAASGEMVHGQFGTVAAWPAKPGYVKYSNIKTPRSDHLYLKLRYSKYSSSSVPILIYLDDESKWRARVTPVDQGSWDKFVWTDAIDLGSVERGIHSLKLYTDGQEYGVADLDKFVLTVDPP
jgi:DNA-binding CsgD family transcriptional regulator